MPSKYPKLNYEKYVYDPVHGYIGLTEQELQIVDDPVFQRLRYIRQLGPAEYVYPTATHSRFTHSIGTMFVMDAFARTLIENGYIPDEDLELLRLTALLHDVGHLPFSHGMETSSLSHEEIGVKLIENYFKDKIAGCDYKDVIAIMRKSHHETIYNYLMSSPLDVDKIDYLLRDAYFTGVQYGVPDVHRLVRTIRIVETERGNAIGIMHKGLPAIENLFIGRYHMYQAVYYHKTVSAFEAMLQKLFDKMMEHEIISNIEDIVKDVKKWINFNDVYLLGKIHEANKLEKDMFLVTLSDMFLRRKPVKLVDEARRYYTLESRDVFSSVDKKYFALQGLLLGGDIRNKVAEDANISVDWIFVYQPSIVMLKDYPEEDIPLYVVYRDGETIPILRDKRSIIVRLKDASYDLLRVYTKKEYRDVLYKALKKLY